MKKIEGRSASAVTITRGSLSYQLFNFTRGISELWLVDNSRNYYEVPFGEIISSAFIGFTSSTPGKVRNTYHIIDKTIYGKDCSLRILEVEEDVCILINALTTHVTFSEASEKCIEQKSCDIPKLEEGKFTFDVIKRGDVTVYRNIRCIR